MTHDVEELSLMIASRLRRAGARLPKEELAAVAEAILADAVHLSLAWLEPEPPPGLA